MDLTKEVPHHRQRLTIHPPQIRPATTTTTTMTTSNNNNVLPTPSKEQLQIITAINKGDCVTVKACAGSGKTTCMLQVAASLPSTRNVIIITYNRSLADECKIRINKLGLQSKIKCYTIHGFVTYLTGTVCNDDHKLIQTVNAWDTNGYHISNPLPFDLVMLDEAQDLRPLFYKTLSYIFGFGGGSSTTSTSATSEMSDHSTSTSTSLSSTSTTNIDGGGTGTGAGLQLCLVGDPKQLLYDFATYGNDKASASFFLQPQKHWGKFTSNRKWIQLPLSVSYRLTPNIASFCNLFWGTDMIGGNMKSPNIPVEYLIKYPYPSSRGYDDPEKLSTLFLAKIIDQHGPENVLFLAQSIKSEKLPIRVHVNELMNIKDPLTGQRKYNFHIKESVRGFEGVADLKNKVRVWTFCGSKGCEADVVIVFGFDVFNGRPHSLNQIGVALSRPKKRLIIIHGCNKSRQGGGNYEALPYYPVLGDSIEGMKQHTIRHGGRQDNSNEEEEIITIDVPCIEQQGGGNGSGGGSGSGTSNSSIQNVYKKRSELTRETLNQFVKSGVTTIDCGTRRSDNSSMPYASSSGIAQKESSEVYVASDFNYFSASAETKYLTQYGVKWTSTNDIIDDDDDKHGSGDGGGLGADDDGIIGSRRITYNTDVQFTTTKEDVSALYGEAVTYMLQWELCRFVPNIETIVSDGLLRLHSFGQYGEKEIRRMLNDMGCEPLTSKDDETLIEEFTTASSSSSEKDTNGGGTTKIKGQDLIRFMNNRMNVKKRRQGRTTSTSDGNDNGNKGDDIWITFPVKAIERKKDDDNNQLNDFLPQIRAVYDLHVKKPFQWIYLANAVMAFSNYHEKFRQIGTDPKFYESWVNPNALLTGLERLKGIMARISPPSASTSTTSDNNMCDVNSGTFERELSYEFNVNDCIKEENNGRKIVGVGGICDWISDVSSKKKNCSINRRQQPQEHKQQQPSYDVDLLEIKFVHQLSNVHRLQVLVYCALYALELNKDNGENDNDDDDDDDDDEYIVEFNDDGSKVLRRSECSGMLYNARTGEIEICSIQTKDAKQFLLDLSQFKYNGTERHQQQQTSIIAPSSKEAKKENGLVSNTTTSRGRAAYDASSSLPTTSSSSFSTWPLKKRFRNGSATSRNHITTNQGIPAAAAADNDDGNGTLNNTTANIDRSAVSWPKRPKKSYMKRLNHAKQQNVNSNNNIRIDLTSNQEAGTDDDPIVLD